MQRSVVYNFCIWGTTGETQYRQYKSGKLQTQQRDCDSLIVDAALPSNCNDTQPVQIPPGVLFLLEILHISYSWCQMVHYTFST